MSGICVSLDDACVTEGESTGSSSQCCSQSGAGKESRGEIHKGECIREPHCKLVMLSV